MIVPTTSGMDSSIEFEAVLDAAREGADRAVAVLYQDLHPRLIRYLRAREPRAAEDLEAEVWLAIATQLRHFEGGEDAFRAWVFSIARRRLADFRRTAARRGTEPVPMEQLERTGGDDTEAIVLDGLAADEAAAFVVRVLPRDQAEVVLLRILGGLDVAHVAALLGKRPGTIRVLQHRAVRRLQRHLSAKSVTR